MSETTPVLPRQTVRSIVRALLTFPEARLRSTFRALARRRLEARPDVRAHLEAGRRVAMDGAEPRVAVESATATPWHLAQRNRELVVRALERAGVDWFEVSSRNALATEVAVVDDDWDAFATALLAELDASSDPVNLGVRARGYRGKLITWVDLASVPEVRAEVRRQDVVTVFAAESLPGHDTAFGGSTGCVVTRWRKEGADWVSPTRNPTTQRVSAALRRTEEQEWRGRTVRRLAGERPTLYDVDFPVDVVYLWVDGSDPAWQKRFAEAKRAELREHPGAAAEAEKDDTFDESVAVWRFRDRDELRHSLRSLEMYLPWVRHVYLVTDQQCPAWLDPDHPKITLVDHRDIFDDPADLPCFNSHAISARLHHIEGLSEHYLMMNDDLFFNAYLPPETFFLGNGTVRYFLSKARAPVVPREDMTAIEGARRNSAELLERDFGKGVTQLFMHSPIVQRRSIMFELEERYPEAFAALKGSHFRAPTDYEVNAWLHHHYAFATGRGLPGRLRYGYFDINKRDHWAAMQRLRPGIGIQTFCINDGPPSEGVDRSGQLPAWLSRYFPRPSSFERGA